MDPRPGSSADDEQAEPRAQRIQKDHRFMNQLVDPRLFGPSVDGPCLAGQSTNPRRTGQPGDRRQPSGHGVDPRQAGPTDRRMDPRLLGQPMDPRFPPPGAGSRKGDPRMDPRMFGQGLDPRIGDPKMDPRLAGDPRMDPRLFSKGFDPRLGDPKMDPRLAGQKMDPRLMDQQGMDPRLRPPPPYGYQPERKKQAKKPQSVNPQVDLAGYIVANAMASSPLMPRVLPAIASSNRIRDFERYSTPFADTYHHARDSEPAPLYSRYNYPAPIYMYGTSSPKFYW
ncbi:hypothetical protein AAVH_27052 [Aphelenchoides avenae]|nr:hypothetical protein AAVH_27052 [Aphelenchus avenae]